MLLLMNLTVCSDCPGASPEVCIAIELMMLYLKGKRAEWMGVGRE